MADILSQGEIDALLSAFATGDSGGAGEASAGDEDEKVRQVKVYDFNHPDRFSKDQIRTMHNLHEQFARLFSTSLSAFLRMIVEVKLVSVDQISYEEFIRSIPNPTSLNIINMDPLEGEALMELSPTLSFPAVDRLMGGQGQVFKKNRELSEIEMTIIEKVLYRAFDCLHEALGECSSAQPFTGGFGNQPAALDATHPAQRNGHFDDVRSGYGRYFGNALVLHSLSDTRTDRQSALGHVLVLRVP